MNLRQLKDCKKPSTLVTNLDIFSPLIQYIDAPGEFPRGATITISGEPGTGKTRYALQVLENITQFNEGLDIWFDSYEMDGPNLSHLCEQLGINNIPNFNVEGKKPIFKSNSLRVIDSLDAYARTHYQSDWPTAELAEDLYKAKKKGATVILIHHRTKGGRQRSGSQHFARDNDVTINLAKAKNGLVVASTKEKCRWPGPENFLELEHWRKGLRLPPPPATIWEHAASLWNRVSS